MPSSPQWFVDRVARDELLVAPGAYDAFTAVTVAARGAEAVYCGGFAATASAFGLPDVGLMGMTDMLGVYRRLAEVIDIPLIVDADTGYGGPLNVIRTMEELGRIGIAAVHIEDQLDPKRCGHVVGKRVVSPADAQRRISAAVGASANGPAVIARTDALAVEGMDSVLERGRRFADAGAHAFFVDAITSVDQITRIVDEVPLPLLYNAAGTGVSPNLSQGELGQLGVSAVIYPIEALMAAHLAARDAIDRIVAGERMEPPMTFAELTNVLHLPEYVARDQELG
jgi:2,3-dimethylmalate lyase